MPTAAKIATVAELTERLQRCNATVVMHYRELKVSEISELRRKLRANGMNIELKVAKNTLLRIAARNAGKPDLDSVFTGPTAVAFIYGSEPQGAKAVIDAVRAVRKENVKVTGGTLGNRALSVDEVQRLTTMPSREEQLAKLMATFQGPATQLAATLNGGVQKLVYTMVALQEKLQAQAA